MFIFLFKYRVERFTVASFIVLYSLSYAKSYVFESNTTIAYHPYQNYVWYRALGLKSTGPERIILHKGEHTKEGVIEEE